MDLPASMVLAVTQTDPAAKGDTRTNALKPATVETGSTSIVTGTLTTASKQRSTSPKQKATSKKKG